MRSTYKAFRIIVPGLMILFLAAMTATQAQTPFKPVPSGQVNQAEQDKARQIADSVLNNWQSGKFEPLSDAFTAQMRQAMTGEVQRSSYQQTKAMFGDYKSLSFAEAVVSPDMPGITVYRFRGAFSQGTEMPEIRVVLDSAGKVGGFWIKPWADALQ